MVEIAVCGISGSQEYYNMAKDNLEKVQLFLAEIRNVRLYFN